MTSRRAFGPLSSSMTSLVPMHTSFWHELRLSISPQTDDEAELVRRQISIQDASTRHLWLVMPLVGLTIALFYSSTVPWPRLIAWWLAMSSICFVTPVVRRRFVDCPEGASAAQ
ncbi:MAG: hypothetical protein KGO02_09180, partial [Alphaproteobacteria bacterium]|nr:hypothetical protein [Alphaproteobacteria bacterium]